MGMLAGAALAAVALAPGPAGGQDFFPGLDLAAQVDVIHLTGNVLSRPDDAVCTFGAQVLVEEARRALRRSGISVAGPSPSATPLEGVVLDVSALVLPVLGTEACAVATRIQLTVGGDAVVLAAEYVNLLTWTATGLLQRVRSSVGRDVATIARALRRARDDLAEAGRD